MEVPGGGNADVVVAVVVPVVDVQTVGVEVADVDAVAVGVKIIACFHPFSPKSLRIPILFFSVFYSEAANYFGVFTKNKQEVPSSSFVRALLYPVRYNIPAISLRRDIPRYWTVIQYALTGCLDYIILL